MNINYKHFYNLCVKYCSQVNNDKHGNGTKLWGYIYQIWQRICSSCVLFSVYTILIDGMLIITNYLRFFQSEYNDDNNNL
jgi:hypothetical protein